jgi:hypothetical protein
VELNDLEPEGFSAGAVSNTSDTTVAELFLEVIVRHVPGRMAGKSQRAITDWVVRDFAVRPCPEPLALGLMGSAKPGRTFMDRPFVGLL